MKYTEKIHAEAIIRILENPEPCEECPLYDSRKLYKINNFDGDSAPKRPSCDICVSFVGLEYRDSFYCPCWQLGKSEVIKRTWLTLEEKGYI